MSSPTVKDTSQQAATSSRLLHFGQALIGFSSRLEPRKLRRILRWVVKKPDSVNVERGCYLLDYLQRSIVVGTFKPADCGAIHTGVYRKNLLRDLAGGSCRPEVPCYSLSKLHSCMGTILWCIYPSDISNIYGIIALPITIAGGRLIVKLEGQDFMTAYLDAMRRYADFKGRSSRSQFWFYHLTLLGLVITAFVLDIVISGTMEPLLSAILIIAHYCPSLAVIIRRPHDADLSGWLCLLIFVPLLGVAAFIVFGCLAPSTRPNRSGSSSKHTKLQFVTDQQS